MIDAFISSLSADALLQRGMAYSTRPRAFVWVRDLETAFRLFF